MRTKGSQARVGSRRSPGDVARRLILAEAAAGNYVGCVKAVIFAPVEGDETAATAYGQALNWTVAAVVNDDPCRVVVELAATGATAVLTTREALVDIGAGAAHKLRCDIAAAGGALHDRIGRNKCQASNATAATR